MHARKHQVLTGVLHPSGSRNRKAESLASLAAMARRHSLARDSPSARSASSWVGRMTKRRFFSCNAFDSGFFFSSLRISFCRSFRIPSLAPQSPGAAFRRSKPFFLRAQTRSAWSYRAGQAKSPQKGSIALVERHTSPPFGEEAWLPPARRAPHRCEDAKPLPGSAPNATLMGKWGAYL